MTSQKVTQPHDSALQELCEQLAKSPDRLSVRNMSNCEHSNEPTQWPQRQLLACADAGVFAWFVPKSQGGLEWTVSDVAEAYLCLSGACLTTTFVLTQLTGACRRLAAASNTVLSQELLPGLVAGKTLCTLGISHLTTSRQHLKRPVLTAESTAGGFVLNGMSPWVTGGGHADYVITGAELSDGRQLLAVVPTKTPGVKPQQPAELVALNGSRTAAVHFDQVKVPDSWLLCEPTEHVMRQSVGGNTGSLQTSTLAIGLGQGAVKFLGEQASKRPDLVSAYDQLNTESESLIERLRKLAGAGSNSDSASELRADANSFVLRSTQSALVAAKGAGYVATHPVGRWCQEALFFLVWSCPQPVLDVNLCELSGLQSN